MDFYYIIIDIYLVFRGVIYGGGVDVRFFCCYIVMVFVFEFFDIWNSVSFMIGDDGLGLGDSGGVSCE